MANHFVKWWKTKFLNSYKQFADGSYGKISDTEELLGGISAEGTQEDQLRISCSTPPIVDQKSLYNINNTEKLEPPSHSTDHNHHQQPQSPTRVTTPTPHQNHQPPTQQNLNFEQFSCDVSVEDGIDKRGQQRQEFSFTLYDFDGYGKITKDDIAGLVTTIYEALGSSVKVPHYGSKTIRVKLTVSPEQRKHVSATVVNQQENTEVVVNTGPAEEPTKAESVSNSRCKKDLNVTIKQKTKSKPCRKTTSYHRRSCRYHRNSCCEMLSPDGDYNHHQSDCVNISDIASVTSSGASGDVSSNDERDCSHYQFSDGRKKLYRKTTNTRQKPPYLEAAKNKTVQDSDSENKHLRSSSLQRQELLEIIKANMNKNNPCLKSARKTNTESLDVQRNQPKNHSKHRRSHRARIPTLQALANIMDPTHFYVDLASFQNTTQLPNNNKSANLQYNKLIDAVMCVSNKRVVGTKRVCRKHKSKVFDGWQMTQSTNVISNSTNPVESTKPQRRSKCNEYEYKGFRRNGKKLPHIVLGTSTSPHYLKHRNRQEDQARAMAQVVKWLEQQFSSNFYDEATGKKAKAGAQAPKAPNSDSASIERHEHHHVHEHIHHHYHHYQDVPIVV